MKIHDQAPVQHVPRTQYESERSARFYPEELVIGADHDLRLIRSPLNEADYAADYAVVIDDIQTIKKKRFLGRQAAAFTEITLLPVTENGEAANQQPDKFLLGEDGVLMSKRRLLLTILHSERGYFAADEGDEITESMETADPLTTAC